MTQITIKNIEELIGDHAGPTKKIVDTKIEKLPPKGVGSIMLKISAKIESVLDGTEEEIHAVAKILPSSELTRVIFDVQRTYKIEIAFYDTILPLLDDFRRENGAKPLECFAQFYGARINLDGSDLVTDDCALVMENLTASGFKNIDRLVGFDLDTAKLVLTDLARFHATTIAFRIKKPQIFQSKILPLCLDLKSREMENGDVEDEWNAEMEKLARALISENKKFEHLKDIMKGEKFSRNVPRGSFVGIAHCDLWVNNTMQKFVDGKAVENKLIDWQCYAHKSCLSDLIFFLFTSLQIPTLTTHLDHLLQFYHTNLLTTLKEIHCNTTEFSYDNFLEDLKYELAVQKEFVHILSFILIIRRDTHLSEEMFEQMQSQPKEDPNDVAKNLPKALKEAVWLFLLEGEKRGWLSKK